VGTYDIRHRDGLAKTGVLTLAGGVLQLPAATRIEGVFPHLLTWPHPNVPPGATTDEVLAHYPSDAEDPVPVYASYIPPLHDATAIMLPGWHTVLRDPSRYVAWLAAIRRATPPDLAWYAPAAALPQTAHILCYSGFDLFDYTAVDLATAQQKFCLPTGDYPSDLTSSGVCACEGCREGDLSLHNRLSLNGELALIAYHIRQGTLRELVEGRCRLFADHVAVMRLLDQEGRIMELATPVARAAQLAAPATDSLMRAEIRRFAERVIHRYHPPRTDVAVLLPCSARKPYSLSRSHHLLRGAICGRGHEVILTSPLGPVPRDLELVYPAAHYDIPVTGYWDREERGVIGGLLAEYLTSHGYQRVIAHLDGGAGEVAEEVAATTGIPTEFTVGGDPLSRHSLAMLSDALDDVPRADIDPFDGTLRWQFGCHIQMRDLRIRGRYPLLTAWSGHVRVFSIDPGRGLVRPTFDGWRRIPEIYRVRIDAFVPQGDVLAPGVTSADPDIRIGDEVLVEGALALATGRAAMAGPDMCSARHGVAVRVRKVKKIAGCTL
jgi:archaeosine synthase